MDPPLIPDGQLVPIPGDFKTVATDVGLRVPPVLHALVLLVPRSKATATRLCDLLDANPAHFIAGLPRWKAEELETAKKRLFAQLAAIGHPYVAPPFVERAFGARPPPPEDPSR